MRAVVQRVSRGQVNVDNKLVASIQRGLVVLLGVSPTDTGQDAQALAEKVANLRIFEDSAGKMNLVPGCERGNPRGLAVHLYADTCRGRRRLSPLLSPTWLSHYARVLWNPFTRWA